jgi:transcriptional regulator with XRE-family HTH domain
MAEKKISGPTLATMTGTSYRTLDDFLRRGSGSFVLLNKIANALGTTMDDLVNGGDIKPSADTNDPIAKSEWFHEAYLNGRGNAPDLAERYRAQAYALFTETAEALASKDIGDMDGAQLDRFLGLYRRIADDYVKYLIIEPIVRNLREGGDADEYRDRLLELSVYLARHGFTEEARGIAEL